MQPQCIVVQEEVQDAWLEHLISWLKPPGKHLGVGFCCSFPHFLPQRPLLHLSPECSLMFYRCVLTFFLLQMDQLLFCQAKHLYSANTVTFLNLFSQLMVMFSRCIIASEFDQHTDLFFACCFNQSVQLLKRMRLNMTLGYDVVIKVLVWCYAMCRHLCLWLFRIHF